MPGIGLPSTIKSAFKNIVNNIVVTILNVIRSFCSLLAYQVLSYYLFDITNCLHVN